MEGSLFSTLVYVALLFGIFYFLLIRPQQKQKKQRTDMIESLDVGSKVYTVGGIIGVITGVYQDTFILMVADGVEIEVLKNSVANIKKEEEEEYHQPEDFNYDDDDADSSDEGEYTDVDAQEDDNKKY